MAVSDRPAPCIIPRELTKLEFDGLNETYFEGFCFELLHELGFFNID